MSASSFRPEVRSSLEAALVAAAESLGSEVVMSVLGRATREIVAAFAVELATRIEGARGLTDSAAAGILQGWMGDNTERRSAIAAVARRVVDAGPDPAVVGPLAALVIHYDGKERDSVFRSVVELLSQLSAREVSELHRIVTWVLAESSREYGMVIVAHEWEERGIPGTRVWQRTAWRVGLLRDENVGRETLPGEGREHRYAWIEPFHDPPHLFSLLRANGLGFEISGSSVGTGTGKLELRRAVLELLATVLGPA